MTFPYNHCRAEALDNHLTAVQRDHELRSQIEERKIRSDAAYEEAKRKEKALQEEKLRQEKAKVESEVCWLDVSVLSCFPGKFFVNLQASFVHDILIDIFWYALLSYLVSSWIMSKLELHWLLKCHFCSLGLSFFNFMLTLFYLTLQDSYHQIFQHLLYSTCLSFFIFSLLHCFRVLYFCEKPLPLTGFWSLAPPHPQSGESDIVLKYFRYIYSIELYQ